MKALRAACLILPWFAYATAPIPAQTQVRTNRVLHGKVVKLREGSSDPVANANVTLEQSGKMVTTNSAGLFFMPLPAELLAGEEIRFNIDVPGYAVFEPAEGRSRIPYDLRKDIVVFGLLPKGSPRFFSHEHLTMLLKGAAEKSTEQVREQGQGKADPDLSRYLKDWAVQYGFGVEQVEAEVDRWIAEVEKKQDIYELGLAAFAKKNFKEAGNLFQESAQQKERKLLAAREREKQLYEETIRDYRLAGDAHYNAYDFQKATELYEKALSLADRQRTPQLWAGTVIDCGNARWILGERASAGEAVTALKMAVEAYRQALGVYTREQLPRDFDWAMAQNNLGNAFMGLAVRSEGPQAVAYREQALRAYRQALEVYTRRQLPRDWAGTQNNLGAALADLAERSEGPLAAGYRDQALAALRNALEVYTREQLPQEWAKTQANLGVALRDLAKRREGPQAPADLEQALGAQRNALGVFTREERPQEWARTQNDLGVTLQALAEWNEGWRAVGYLREAVGAFRKALEVETREQLPLEWARTQGNLAVALWVLAGRSEEAAELLKEAVGALRSALEVYSREEHPQEWATAQNDLGAALRDLALWSEGPQVAGYREEALSAYRSALEVRTRARRPQDWAETQNNLGNLLRDLAGPGNGPRVAAHLEEAVDAYRHALEVYTRAQRPQDWALAQNNLGLALGDLALRSDGPQAAAYLEQAVEALRGALGVRTEASMPQQWSETLRDLAVAYREKRDYAHALEAYEKLARHYPENPLYRAMLQFLSKLP